MIRLIILGAGASVDCGLYPTGVQFVEIAEKILSAKELVANNQPGGEKFHQHVLSSKRIRFALEKLISANPSSIDAYISGINSLKEKLILKALIVSILRVCTTYSEAFSDRFKNNWYFSIWQLIELELRNCSTDAEKIKKLENAIFRIVTFNYDISLELFLWKRIQDNFRGKEEKEQALVIIAEKIITHVYGRIGHWREVVNGGDYSKCENLIFNNFSETEAKAFDMTTVLSKHPEILTARVLSLVEKILEQTDVEEKNKNESQVVTELLSDICVIGHERSEIKKGITKLFNDESLENIYILGYGFDPANNKLINLRNIKWRKGCFVTNFEGNKRSERIIYNELSRLVRENIFGSAVGKDYKREFRIPLISKESVKGALGAFSLLEELEVPDMVIRTDLTPYVAMQK
jgi:hypothetical protein